MHIALSASSIIVLTKLNIIGRLHSVIRLISRLTPLDLKQKKKSFAHICLSALTTKRSIKLIATYVYFGSISSTRNSIQGNIKSFIKTEANLST